MLRMLIYGCRVTTFHPKFGLPQCIELDDPFAPGPWQVDVQQMVLSLV